MTFLQRIMKPDNVLYYEKTMSQDLVAAAAATTNSQVNAEGKTVIFSDTVPDNSVLVVVAAAPFALARLNVDTVDPQSTETVEYISPKNGDGFFLYEFRGGERASKLNLGNNLAAWTNAIGATVSDMKTSSGLVNITDDPARLIASRMSGPSMFVVSPGPFAVLWSLIPEAQTQALNARYGVGGATSEDPGLKRVDYAGITVAGYLLSKSVYDNARRNG